jgi:hypothetical protein
MRYGMRMVNLPATVVKHFVLSEQHVMQLIISDESPT